MSVLTPIAGQTSVKAGYNTTYTNTTTGGSWSSSNTGYLTIDAVSGAAVGISAGNVQVIYTIGSDSIALQVTVQTSSSLTNGIDFNTVYAALQNRVLWQSQGVTSDSQRYFEDFHPLNDTELIDKCRPTSGSVPLATFLSNMQRAIIMQMLAAVYDAPVAVDVPKLAFWRNDTTRPLVNVRPNGQFVGLKLYISKGDFGVKVNSLQLFFTKAATFNLYVYNDFFLNPLATISVTCAANELTIIDLGQQIVLSNLAPNQYKGGRWYIGYYQDDLPAGCEAVYYPVGYNRFAPVTCIAFSAPLEPNPNDGSRNFDRSNIGANNLMYGMNFEISTFIDATNTIVQNMHLFDDVIGMLGAVKSIEIYKYSYRSGGDKKALDAMGGLDRLNIELNGSAGNYLENKPKVIGLLQRLRDEYKKVKQALQPSFSQAIGKP